MSPIQNKICLSATQHKTPSFWSSLQECFQEKNEKKRIKNRKKKNETKKSIGQSTRLRICVNKCTVCVRGGLVDVNEEERLELDHPGDVW